MPEADLSGGAPGRRVSRLGQGQQPDQLIPTSATLDRFASDLRSWSASAGVRQPPRTEFLTGTLPGRLNLQRALEMVSFLMDGASCWWKTIRWWSKGSA